MAGTSNNVSHDDASNSQSPALADATLAGQGKSGFGHVISLLHILRACDDESETFYSLLYLLGNSIGTNTASDAGQKEAAFKIRRIILDKVLKLPINDLSDKNDDWADKMNRILNSIVGLVNGYLLKVELAVCYDVAQLTGNIGKGPTAISETNLSYWVSIFSGHPTDQRKFPIETGYAGADTENYHMSTSYRKIYHREIKKHLLYVACQLAKKILKGVSTSMLPSGGGGKTGLLTYIDDENKKETIRSRISRLLLTKTDNLDLSQGPVRWKITKGSFPINNFDAKIQDNVRAIFLPEYITEFETNKQFKNDSSLSDEENLENKNTVNITYDFLLNKENFVPITYIPDSERPSAPGSSNSNRGILQIPIQYCIYNQEGIQRTYRYLENLQQQYANAKNNIKGFKDSFGGSSLKEIAKLPAIDVKDIMKYSSKRQSSLRKFIKSEEEGMKYQSYVSQKNYISETCYRNLVSLVSQITKNIATRGGKDTIGKVNEGRIHAIGLPSGIMDVSNQTTSDKRDIYTTTISIQQDTTLLYEAVAANTIERFYWPNLFITNKEFAKLESYEDYDKVMENLNYTYIDKEGSIQTCGLAKLKSLLESIAVDSETSEIIIKNHINDFILKLYLKHYSGINVDEANFSIVPNSNDLYVDDSAIDKFDIWAKSLNIKKDHILKGKSFVDFKTYKKNSNSSDYSSYSRILSLAQSRLLSKEQMATKIFVPNIFDRIFCFYTHIAEYEFPNSITNNSGNYELSDGGVYKVNLLEGGSGNRLMNDHMTNNIYTLTLET